MIAFARRTDAVNALFFSYFYSFNFVSPSPLFALFHSIWIDLFAADIIQDVFISTLSGGWKENIYVVYMELFMFI